MSVHFSSKTDMHATPQKFFDSYNDVFKFTTDVCASPENAKCEHYFTVADNGLAQDWAGNCWMNPPYGREIIHWMRKAYESSLIGATVVCLVPARTDTKWWHEYAMKGDIEFIRGRLKFGDAKNSAPFPSAVVIFRGALNCKLLDEGIIMTAEQNRIVKIKTRTTQLTVSPEGADLYDDRSTHIEIDDEGGGEFIKIVQPHGSADIRIDPNEWPVIRAAIDKMIKECRK